MTDKKKATKEERREDTQAKRRYEKPEVVEYGDVREFTKAGGGSNPEGVTGWSA